MKATLTLLATDTKQPRLELDEELDIEYLNPPEKGQGFVFFIDGKIWSTSVIEDIEPHEEHDVMIYTKNSTYSFKEEI